MRPGWRYLGATDQPQRLLVDGCWINSSLNVMVEHLTEAALDLTPLACGPNNPQSGMYAVYKLGEPDSRSAPYRTLEWSMLMAENLYD